MGAALTRTVLERVLEFTKSMKNGTNPFYFPPRNERSRTESHTERAKYLTDLTDKQWQNLLKILPQPSRRGAPQKICRRAALDAIIYVVRSGCPWRLLPHEFPNWKTVYGIFLGWRNEGPGRGFTTRFGICFGVAGTKKSPSAAIIDSQTVKTSEVGGQRGYDAGKKINGRKRHIVVDTLGLILRCCPSWRCSGPGWSGAALAISRPAQRKVSSAEGNLRDSAYGRNNLPECVKDAFGWLLQTVLRPAKVKGFVVLPKRWIVERTFGWLGHTEGTEGLRTQHRIERGNDHIAMSHIMLRRLACQIA